MATNKVVYGDVTLIDLTGDTVDAASLAKGVTAHDKSGAAIVGTMEAGGANVDYIQTTNSEGNTFTITGLKGKPKVIAFNLQQEVQLGSTRIVSSIISDGTNTYGTCGCRSGLSNSREYVSTSYYSWTYSNGTLTLKSTSNSTGGAFKGGYKYGLFYVY